MYQKTYMISCYQLSMMSSMPRYDTYAMDKLNINLCLYTTLNSCYLNVTAIM